MILDHPWPSLNAFLNGTSAILLAVGFRFILQRRVAHHQFCMQTALVTSTLFLISYLAYHAQAGHVRFLGTGWVRPLYFTLLLSHTLLAFFVPPLALRTFYLAKKERWTHHRRLARWTLPIWFYVSVTGVVIYLMLYGNRSV